MFSPTGAGFSRLGNKPVWIGFQRISRSRVIWYICIIMFINLISTCILNKPLVSILAFLNWILCGALAEQIEVYLSNHASSKERHVSILNNRYIKKNLTWIQIEFVLHLIIFIVVRSRSAKVSKSLIKLYPFICFQPFKPRQAVDKRNYTPRYGQVTKAKRNLLRVRDRETEREREGLSVGVRERDCELLLWLALSTFCKVNKNVWGSAAVSATCRCQYIEKNTYTYAYMHVYASVCVWGIQY